MHHDGKREIYPWKLSDRGGDEVKRTEFYWTGDLSLYGKMWLIDKMLVYAVASGKANVNLMKELGSDVVINGSEEDIAPEASKLSLDENCPLSVLQNSLQ